jgi:[ribosomal protein S5]-alanine N-acetyltransferase
MKILMLLHTLSNKKLLLKRLSIKDADSFYAIYADPLVTQHYDQAVFLPDETPQLFTKRIISVCEGIWTIRLKDDPGLTIGDVALHHYNEEENSIQIGGSLLPSYWVQDIMKDAFALLIDLAKKELLVTSITAITNSNNLKAIRFAEKLGFIKVSSDDNEVHLRLDL